MGLRLVEQFGDDDTIMRLAFKPWFKQLEFEGNSVVVDDNSIVNKFHGFRLSALLPPFVSLNNFANSAIHSKNKFFYAKPPSKMSAGPFVFWSFQKVIVEKGSKRTAKIFLLSLIGSIGAETCKR
uniref:Uncharacterized protein n=1 Tax=Parascaris equorum TaxID=6256 RepID=A0A914RTN4_PAREQ